MTDVCHKIFVYGTLKKGQPNEYFMGTNSVEYLGTAKTKLNYPLIIGGEWNLPMLLNLEETGKRVKGELYLVNDVHLTCLDQFEGHPDLYERTEIDVIQIPDSVVSSCVRCWTYFFKGYTVHDLGLEYHDNYDSAGSHGRAYDTRENMDHPVNTESNFLK